MNWSLNRDEIKKLKQLKFEQKIESNNIYIGQIPFCIELYPKGFGSENYIGLFLLCEAQGLDISEIVVWYCINIHEVGYRFITNMAYTNFPASFGIPFDLVKSIEILNLKNLKIETQFQILSLKDNDGNIINLNDWNKLFELKNDIKLLKIDNEARNQMVIQNQEIINDLKKEIISLKIKNDEDIKALKKDNKQNRYELIISFIIIAVAVSFWISKFNVPR